MGKKYAFENKHGVRIIMKASTQPSIDSLLAVPPTPNEMDDICMSMREIISRNKKSAQVQRAIHQVVQHIKTATRSEVK